MIDISQLKYRLVLLDETGKQYDLKDIIQDLGWEENENELATRITFKLAKIDREGIADGLMKNGRMVFLMAQTGEAEAEVCRGFIKTHQDSYSLTARPVDGTAYDMLHQLDRSQDNRHITSGRTTKTIIFEIAADWGIPISEYQGPDVAHGKMDFKSKPPAKNVYGAIGRCQEKRCRRICPAGRPGDHPGIARYEQSEYICIQGEQ